jgi:hypothetical protein
VGAWLGFIPRPHHQQIPAFQLLLAQIATYVPLAGYLLLVLPRLSGRSFRQLGIRRPKLRDLRAGVVGALIMWLVVTISSAILVVITNDHEPEAALQVLHELRPPFQTSVFTLVALVLAPLVEELLFRVFLFNAFARYFPIMLSALLSGLLFGIVHITSYGQLVTIGIPLALGGMTLALVYARTGCYWANVLTHGLFNSVTIVAYFVFHVDA